MNLPHLASRLYGTPLLLARSKLDIILAVLGSRVGWPTAAELALPPSRASPVTPPTAATGIAVIPVHGSLVRRAFAVDAASGLTSLLAAIAIAVAKPRQWVDDLAADEAILLAAKGSEVNADFFTRTVLPKLDGLFTRAKGLVPATAAAPVESGSTPSSA